MTPRVVSGGADSLREALAAEFARAAALAMAARGRFVVALPGGSVGPIFFPALATLAVDWTRTEFFWIDERAVPPDHPDSNFALASRLWLDPAGVPPDRVHRLRGEMDDLDAAARLAGEAFVSVAGNPPRLDVAIVGVGEDGHVASLFPGSAGLRSASAFLPVYDSPKPPPRRLTMTLDLIAGARLVVVAAPGDAKARVMREALGHREAATPVAELLRRAASPLVLVDRAAAV